MILSDAELAELRSRFEAWPAVLRLFGHIDTLAAQHAEAKAEVQRLIAVVATTPAEVVAGDPLAHCRWCGAFIEHGHVCAGEVL